MNKDQFEGSWREFKGEVKKKWGELTDSDLLEIEGNYDKFLGVLQKRYGDRKVEIERWVKDWPGSETARSAKAQQRDDRS